MDGAATALYIFCRMSRVRGVWRPYTVRAILNGCVRSRLSQRAAARHNGVKLRLFPLSDWLRRAKAEAPCQPHGTQKKRALTSLLQKKRAKVNLKVVCGYKAPRAPPLGDADDCSVFYVQALRARARES